MRKRPYLLSFFGILILATVIRVTGLTFESLWLDEGYQSMAGATGRGLPDFLNRKDPYIFRFEKPAEPGVMLARFREVDPLCPPLYALFLNRWLTFFGDGDAAIRSLSVVASVLNCLILTVLASLICGPRAGLFAGLFSAVSPFDVHYAQEARMYSFVTLWSTVSCGCLIYFLKRGFDRFSRLSGPGTAALLSVYTIATCALINSHYTGLFICLAQGIASVALILAGKRFRLLPPLFFCWIAVGVLWLPFLEMFFKAASVRGESFYVAREPGTVWPFYGLFVRIPVNFLSFLSGMRVYGQACVIYVTSALLLLSTLPSLVLRGPERFSVRALFAWAVLPCFALWLSDVMENHKVVEVTRYTAGVSPALFMLAGYGASNLLKLNRRFIWLPVIHVMFAFVNLYYCHTIYQKEPWRDMAAVLEQKVATGDELVLVSEYYNIACLDRYLNKPLLQVGISPAMGREAVHSRIAGRRRFLLVTAQEGEFVKDLIPEEFEVKDRVDLMHGLHLRVYETKARLLH